MQAVPFKVPCTVFVGMQSMVSKPGMSEWQGVQC